MCLCCRVADSTACCGSTHCPFLEFWRSRKTGTWGSLREARNISPRGISLRLPGALQLRTTKLKHFVTWALDLLHLDAFQSLKTGDTSFLIRPACNRRVAYVVPVGCSFRRFALNCSVVLQQRPPLCQRKMTGKNALWPALSALDQ